jgi:hypothetical protein
MQENIIISLINTQKYTVIEKQRLDELLAEYDFQQSGLVGEDSMTLGKFLEVDAVIIGNMSGEGPSRRLALQVIDVNSYKTLASVSQYLLAENAVPAAPAQTLLPLAGGTADERTIFASFMIELGSFADGSGDSALAPKGRTWDMWTGAGLETVFNLGKGRGMSDAILVNIEKTGQRNQAIAARVDIANRSRVAVSTLEYYDPIELWLKMPRLVDQLKTPRQQFSDYDTYTSTSSYRYFAEKDQTPVFAMYRPGVNRAETEPLIQRLLQESQLLFETGIFDKVYLLDRTKDYEAAIAAKNLSAAWERNYAQIRKWKLKNGIKSPTADDYTETRAIFAFNGELDTAAANMKFDENLLIEVTRQGNRTRLELLRGNASLLPGSDPKYTVLALDYSSPADFNLKLRTFSQAVIQIFQQEDTVVSIGVQGYDPSVRRQGGTVPADLVEIKRDGAQGNMPLRGFHMGKYEVTQKEFEGLMGYNPATVKSANLPVDNISLIDAAGYCNALSLRDGLEPAYYILDRREVGSAERLRIVRNDEANGYRMPFDDEWNFAAVDELSSIRSTDVSSILSVEELREEYGWFEGNSGGSLHPVGQKAPNQFGLYDMWGNVDEWAHDDRTAKLAEEGRNILKGGNYRTPPDLAALDDDLTNADKDKGNVRNYVGATFPVITDGKAKFERKSIYLEAIPGIRVVRPVFDFWKFTGDSGQ